MPTDYSLSKIYKLTSEDTDHFWIGSTTQALKRRLMDHRIKYEKSENLFEAEDDFYSHTELWMFMNYTEIKIELIEAFECLNKIQLDKRVNEIIKINMINAINIIPDPIPEAAVKPINKRAAANKKYYEDNKADVLAKKAVRMAAMTAEEKVEARNKYRTDNKAAINTAARRARRDKALAQKKD